MPIHRAENVGSLLRPPELLAARAAFQNGRLSDHAFKKVEDRAVDFCVAVQERSGIGVVTDGEMRRNVFASQLVQAVEGFDTVSGNTVDWFTMEGQKETSPVTVGLVGKLKRRRHLSAEEFVYLRARTRMPIKVTLPSPTMYAYYWVPGVSEAAYPNPDAYLADVADILRDEVRELVRLGCDYIQFDAPEFGMVLDPHQQEWFRRKGFEPAKLVHDGVNLMNAITAGQPAECTFGLHVCRGNDANRYMGKGSYAGIAEEILRRTHATVLLLEYDDERSGDFSPLGKTGEDKIICLGLVTTKRPREETEDEVIRRIHEAAQFVPLERLTVSTQCGFASVARGATAFPSSSRSVSWRSWPGSRTRSGVKASMRRPHLSLLGPRRTAQQPDHSVRRLIRGLGCAVLLAAGVGTRPQPAPAQLPPFLELRVPKAPTVATGDGAPFLAYELHVTSFAAQPVTLKQVEVSATGAGGVRRVLLSLSDSGLGRGIARPGAPGTPFVDRPKLVGGARAVVFLWVPVDPGGIPASVINRVTIEDGAGDSIRTQHLDGQAVPVAPEAAPVAAPLRGGVWLAGNGPNPDVGHRRALIPIGGVPSIAQRFAIDWVKVGPDHTTFTGDRLKNESYHAYGQDALAVADGIVAAMKDGIPENIPGPASRAVPITLETVGGNYVILEIGGGRHAFYAHLQPGSLTVKAGDRVKRGQVLGLVGNSGNSTEPHLHFHISDGTSPLGSEGLPYRLVSFELVGRCRSFGTGCERPSPTARRGEIPMGNMLVAFP